MHLVTNIHEKAGKMLEGKLKLGYAVRSPGVQLLLPITSPLIEKRPDSRGKKFFEQPFLSVFLYCLKPVWA